MSYATAHIAEALRAARQAAGLSQRDLAQRAGVPQPHISKIENDAVDLRVSSLIAIASALDLELTLIPRKAAPAVRSIARMTEPGERADPQASTELAKTQQVLARVEGRIDPHGEHRTLQQLRQSLAALHQLALSASDAKQLQDIRRDILKLDDAQDAAKALATLTGRLDRLRDRLIHTGTGADASPARPAYRLDEDDDG